MKILAQGSGLLGKMVKSDKESAPISKSTVVRIVSDTEVEAKTKPIAKGGKLHVQIGEKYIKMDGKGHKTRYVTATVFDGISPYGKKNRLDHRILISGVELGDVAVTGLGEDAIKVYRPWEMDKNFFAAWSDPDYKGCCQEAMNSHYYAARFGKFGGSFKERTVKKLSLVIEAGLNGWDLTSASPSAQARLARWASRTRTG